MRGPQTAIRIALALGVALALAAPGAAGDYSVVANGQRIRTRVKSLLEIRDQNLVRQGWDISCGAAALSTVLTYDFREPYTEATIALSILANTDPAKVRARGGFSLLDLKRFAEAVGYSARGYGGLSLGDLANSSVPIILPVRVKDFDHFVVYRGRYAGRVLVGDPAFGNLTLSERRFAEIWSSGIGFFVAPPDAEIWGGEPLAPETMNLTVPDLNYVERLLREGGITPTTRRPQPTGM